MKRSKNLVILLAVLVILAGAVAVVQSVNNRTQQLQEEESTTVFTVDTQTVTALTWHYVDETVTFEKTEDGWAYAEDENFPLDSSYLETMLDALTQVEASRVIEQVEDLAEYGLENPDCTVTVQTDRTLEISFGSQSALGEERYISIGDGNVYLVDASLQDPFELGLYDVVKMESLPDMQTMMLAIVDDGETQKSYLRQENSNLTYSNQYVWFLYDGETYQTLDTDLTEAWLENVGELTWAACVQYQAGQDELESCGLAEPAVRVSFIYEDEDGNSQTFGLEFGTVSGNYCYAKLANSTMVYKVDANILESLQSTTYYDLRPSEVYLADWDILTGMDVTLDGVTYEFRKENGQDEYAMTLNGEEVTITALRNLMNALPVSGYADGIQPEGTSPFSIQFYRNAETYPEVELAFYPYNSTDELVTLNGTTLCLAPVERVNSVIQAVKNILE